MKFCYAMTLFLLALQLNACSSTKDADSQDKTPSTTLTQEELNERHAVNFLAAAKAHQKEDQSDLAVKVIRELLEMYPESKPAVEAKKLLQEWEQNSGKSTETKK